MRRQQAQEENESRELQIIYDNLQNQTYPYDVINTLAGNNNNSSSGSTPPSITELPSIGEPPAKQPKLEAIAGESSAGWWRFKMFFIFKEFFF